MVRTKSAPTRADVHRRNIRMVAIGIVAGVAVFLLVGQMRISFRPLSLLLATSLGAMAAALVGFWIVFTRGQSMLGRPYKVIVTVLVAALLFSLAWKVGVTALYNSVIERSSSPTGFDCLTVSLAVGASPLLIALMARRRSDPVSPALTGATFGAAVGLGTISLMTFSCPIVGLAHLLLGHVVPMIILSAIGALLGGWLLSIRVKPS
jgi:hypothetical protein